MKLILNCPRALAITCLSHEGQNFVQRTTFKVLPSRKQVCRLSLFNRLAVAWGKPTIIVSKTQQVQLTQSNLFTNKTLSNLILFTCFAKLATAWNYSSIDNRRKHVSKRALITSWIQNCPFHCETFTYQHNLRIFYTDKVSCNTNKATPSKTKKPLTFSLAALKFCNSSLVHHQPSPLKRFSGCESIQF